MQRGELDRLSLSVSLYTPALQTYLRRLKNNPATIKSLGEYADINPSVSLSEMEPDTTVGFIPMEAVSDGATGEYTVRERLLGEVSKGYTRFTDGDILWAKITPCMQNGKSCLVNGLPNQIGFGSTEFHVLRVRSDLVSKEFIREFVNQETLRRIATYAFTGSAGQQRVPAAFLENLPFPELSKSRQNELVATMDAARAERKAKLAEADALLAGIDGFLLEALGMMAPVGDGRRVFAVSSEGVFNRLDPHFHSPDFARIERMLAQVNCEPLGRIATFSKETWRPQDHGQPAFRYIEINTVNPQTGEANWNEVPTLDAPSRARMKVQANDIIVSLTRPHHGSIAYLGPEFDGCIASTGFAVIRNVPEHISRDYLWCVLRAQFCLQQMLQRASGGNYPAITEPELAKILVPVPDKTIQNDIAAEVSRRSEATRRLRAEAEAWWERAKGWFEEELLGANNATQEESKGPSISQTHAGMD